MDTIISLIQQGFWLLAYPELRLITSNQSLQNTLKWYKFYLLSSWLQLNIKRGMGILPVHRLEACSTI